MSFSSRRRNYLLTPHRRDGLIEWMKSMLMHSFVLDALDTTGGDTFSHFEMLIDEHRRITGSAAEGSAVSSRLKQLVPTVGTFYTRLPLRRAFEAYNAKYGITKRRHICISFNEIRHILNLAQIIAMTSPSGGAAGRRDSRLALEALKSVGNAAAAQLNDQDEKEKRDSLEDADALRAWAETPRTDWTLDPTSSPGASTATASPATPSSIHQLVSLSAKGHCDHQDSSSHQDSNSHQDPSNHDDRQLQRERSESFLIEHTLAAAATEAKITICGPKLLCFDGDQTLYSDGANFESNPKLAKYLYLLLKHGVTIAVVTAAGYEYQSEKYELRLSGLLRYFQQRGLDGEDLERFYIFGGECNYLLRLGEDYKLHAVREYGPGGWLVSTKHLAESPGNWSDEAITSILDKAYASFQSSLKDQNMRARIIRKKRSVGLIPKADEKIPREALDEAVLRIQTELEQSQFSSLISSSYSPKTSLPFCAFNGGRDAWVDVGNKRVGVQVLQSYLGIPPEHTLHIGDQFLNTGNDFAARSVCPCVWITSPEETTYILKSILRLAGVPLLKLMNPALEDSHADDDKRGTNDGDHAKEKKVDFKEVERRTSCLMMDVYTGEMISKKI